MPAELNGLPADGTAGGINGHANELSNPAPADSAFDSIPDVVAAFGQPNLHIHLAHGQLLTLRQPTMNS